VNSTNPNRGHYNPAPVITHPKAPAPDNRTTGQGGKPAGGKGGGSR
jgi:hypothetical protein